MTRIRVGCGLGLALVLLVAWWYGGEAPPPLAAAPAGRPFPWATTPAATAALPVLPASSGRVPEEPDAPDVPARPAVLDLCGLGRLSLPAGAEVDALSGDLEGVPAPVGRALLAQARERLVADLRAGDAGARVAAMLLDRPVVDDEPARTAWAQALLQEAMASRSAVALAWAETACAYLPEGGDCRLALVRARLQLEPDNAHHWAALADEDPAAADEAWRGLLQARRWHESPHALLVTTQTALPRELPGYLRQALGVMVSQRAAALPAPGEGFVQERCREPAPGRQQECDHLARLLLDNGDSLHALSQAAQLAEAAGWTSDRIEAVSQELRALARPGAQWAPDPQQPLSCASVEGWQRHVTEVAQRGELGALRALHSPARDGR